MKFFFERIISGEISLQTLLDELSILDLSILIAPFIVAFTIFKIYRSPLTIQKKINCFLKGFSSFVISYLLIVVFFFTLSFSFSDPHHVLAVIGLYFGLIPSFLIGVLVTFYYLRKKRTEVEK